MAKRGRPKRGETRAPKAAPLLHLIRVASLDARHTLCGQLAATSQIAPEVEDVTCKQCKRIAEAHPEHKTAYPKYSRAMDSLIGKAFIDAERQLQAALQMAVSQIKEHEHAFSIRAATSTPEYDELLSTVRPLLKLLGGDV